jgi:hypothetical protein
MAAVLVGQEDNVNNVTLTKGSTVVTIYTARVVEDVVKDLRKIKPPTSSGKRDVGAKDVKILDLLIIEERFTISGFVDVADKATLRGLVTSGGTMSLAWDGDTIEVNCDKLSITKDEATYSRDESTEAVTGARNMRSVTLTCIKGTDL